MEALDYNAFAGECVEELKVLQNKFREEYNLSWYENWFYNQSTGLFTFSTDDVELNFKYFQVGSFSKKTNTWKWAWDNDNTLDNVKEITNVAKEFGQKNNFNKLTNAYFESDEIEAWEFTAIAAKLTNGIGTYRPVDEHLQIFLVITELVDSETAQSIKARYVECGAHEYRRIAFVCKHLNHSTKVGFEEAFETFGGMELLEDDDFQAWCNKCERVRKKEKGWNDKSMEFAQIKFVCEDCYFEMKELNLGYR
ncbi:DUF6882 domain-containing protein [Hymenobacter sp. GOD-10R]|uniref:DUF6882 domain-containing protein n=1 Tax=Hymenobacter sp. GOD-10R TaxID=3093922 RepID=UPI002D76536F|nr:DUF6882 domain-containing protein [Hymenobacter sp. GOD-10R]WRQ30055.1 hypothetical protein SD425_07250 [Hymenobacter sp. GOD-10R]